MTFHLPFHLVNRKSQVVNRTPQFFIWELEYNFVFLHRLAKYGAIGT